MLWFQFCFSQRVMGREEGSATDQNSLTLTCDIWEPRTRPIIIFFFLVMWQAEATSAISYRTEQSSLSRTKWRETPLSGTEDRVDTEPLPPEASAHLCEVDWSVFGNAVSVFAGKHPTITSIHLLWNFLKDQKQRKGDTSQIPSFLLDYK